VYINKENRDKKSEKNEREGIPMRATTRAIQKPEHSTHISKPSFSAAPFPETPRTRKNYH